MSATVDFLYPTPRLCYNPKRAIPDICHESELF